MTSRELHWNISGEHLAVRVEESKGEGIFHIADRSIPFHIVDHNTLEIGGRHVRFHIVRDGDSYTVWINGRTYQLKRTSKSHLAEAAATSPTGEITALMPGKVLRIEVAVGDTVSEKQTVAIMESMKMESALHAPKAGRIAEIRCQPGQVVEMGEVIMVID
jgi:biotin carboxyl carrier protein